jgi:hypothetical protein
LFPKLFSNSRNEPLAFSMIFAKAHTSGRKSWERKGERADTIQPKQRSFVNLSQASHCRQITPNWQRNEACLL